MRSFGIFLVTMSLLIGASSNAQTPLCSSDIGSIIEERGNPSDQPASPEYEGVLKAGAEFEEKLGPYPEDTVIYTNTGSYYSGWFREAFVLDQKCNLVHYELLYGE